MQPLLQALHWVPVKARMGYKLSAICHNFSDSFPHVGAKTSGQRCFSYCAGAHGMRSLPTSVTFSSPATPSELQFSLQTIPQQAIQIPSSAGTDFQCHAHHVVDHRLRTQTHRTLSQTRGTLKHTDFFPSYTYSLGVETALPAWR